MNLTSTRAANNLPFNSQYWEEMYEEDEKSVIDGIFNAKEHSKYCKSFFNLIEIKIKTIADIGFGKGLLLKEFAKQFKPEKIIALDPSKECVDSLIQEDWIRNYSIAVFHSNFESFQSEFSEENCLDLSICNSVFQYFPDSEVEILFEKLSKMSRFVYFTVPTSEDYKYMKESLNFSDPYAYNRSDKFYKKRIYKFFNKISFNLLESKICNTNNNDYFLGEFFRKS
jgi:ubiquinone/menaquinone biosynthesis C-methylase UbiE